MRIISHWIDGANVPIGDANRLPIFDPATGRKQAEVAIGGALDVDAAVTAASTAWETWRDSSLSQRQTVMFAMRQRVIDTAEELAGLISSEHGKTVPDAHGEIRRGIEVLEFASGIAHHLKGDISSQVSRGVDMSSLRHPLGVVAGVSPFNFPIMVPMWMHPIAIATGNTFILKPSEKNPTVSNRVAQLYAEAGLPPGVFNVVHGDASTVNATLDHPGIAAVSSVGSTAVARIIHERATKSGKRVQALGGAKNHMIVLPDADLGAAADAAVSAAYGSAGERCMAISVLLAHEEIADPLLQRIAERTEKLRVGPGNRPDIDMGPLITGAHRDRVVDLIGQGVDAGAELVVDGRVHASVDTDGFFVGPTLFDKVAPNMSISIEEIFGPVLNVSRVASLDEAIDMINANPYGNGAAVFTNDAHSIRVVQQRLDIGMIGVNVPVPVPLGFYSFGGWKDSNLGAHGVYGPEGIAFYTRAKVMISRHAHQPRTETGSQPLLAFDEH